MRRPSRNTLASLAGLLVGIAGLLVQWSADPSRFAGDPFPPGIAFIAAAGILMLLTARWWWHPIFGVLIAFWIVVGGTLAGKMLPNLTSHNLGTLTGTLVMSAGLIFAVVTGIRAMATARRATRATRTATPDPTTRRPDSARQR